MEQRRFSVSRTAVTILGFRWSRSTACGLRCITKATRKVGVFEEVGGGCGGF